MTQEHRQEQGDLSLETIPLLLLDKCSTVVPKPFSHYVLPTLGYFLFSFLLNTYLGILPPRCLMQTFFLKLLMAESVDLPLQHLWKLSPFLHLTVTACFSLSQYPPDRGFVSRLALPNSNFSQTQMWSRSSSASLVPHRSLFCLAGHTSSFRPAIRVHPSTWRSCVPSSASVEELFKIPSLPKLRFCRSSVAFPLLPFLPPPFERYKVPSQTWCSQG